MCRFFEKHATVVDITDKEVIDCFQDGLYHRRTFEDFGHRRPSSITKLKDKIISWADEEDKGPAKDNSKKPPVVSKNCPKRSAHGTRRTTTLSNSATNFGGHSSILQSHTTLTTRRERAKSMKATMTSKTLTR
jgi:hypothetical protein